MGSCGSIETQGFLCISVGARAWEAPESLETNEFLYISIISLVERRAWEGPESLKTNGFRYILIIPLVERRA